MRIRIRMIAALALYGAGAAAQEDEGDAIRYAPRAAAPPGYPAGYQALVRAAEDEGRLIVYSNTDAAVARPLIADFSALYPRIEVQYEDLNATELHHRFVAEAQLGGETADVLWSSAMDQQASLVSNGYALAYASPEAPGLPDWARWTDMAWATTFEPIALVYDKRALQPAEVPRTHADLAKLLQADPARLRAKVISYDIQKSGLGFFLATQDAGASPAFWDIAQGLGKVAARLTLNTETMLRSVASGQSMLGYNVLGSYALARVQRDPNLGVVFPSDYTLVLSRVMFITRRGRHPNAARLWVDYVLSKRGQTLIANGARLFAVRADIDGETTAARLTQTLGPALRPIPLGPPLIGYLNNQNYIDFIRRWQQATAPARAR
ncbi:MAG: ABC transporter substrate-binding protein [Rubrivivax sp.]